jgi:hypothetical protein
VDLIPYERKEEMILSFENLFSLPMKGTRIYNIRDQIRDITEGGSSGFHARVGHIHNINKLKPDRNQAVNSNEMWIYDDWGVKAEIPTEVDIYFLMFVVYKVFSQILWIHCIATNR